MAKLTYICTKRHPVYRISWDGNTYTFDGRARMREINRGEVVAVDMDVPDGLADYITENHDAYSMFKAVDVDINTALLAELKRSPGTLTQLGERLNIQWQTLNRKIKPLLEDGIVQKDKAKVYRLKTE